MASLVYHTGLETKKN